MNHPIAIRFARFGRFLLLLVLLAGSVVIDHSLGGQAHQVATYVLAGGKPPIDPIAGGKTQIDSIV
jgi:hypothetical protein